MDLRKTQSHHFPSAWHIFGVLVTYNEQIKDDAMNSAISIPLFTIQEMQKDL